jgi:hypothetical protein
MQSYIYTNNIIAIITFALTGAVRGNAPNLLACCNGDHSPPLRTVPSFVHFAGLFCPLWSRVIYLFIRQEHAAKGPAKFRPDWPPSLLFSRDSPMYYANSSGWNAPAGVGSTKPTLSEADCSTICNVKAHPPLFRLYPIPTTILQYTFGLGPVSGRLPRCLHTTMPVIPLSCFRLAMARHATCTQINPETTHPAYKVAWVCRTSARVVVYVTWHTFILNIRHVTFQKHAVRKPCMCATVPFQYVRLQYDKAR